MVFLTHPYPLHLTPPHSIASDIVHAIQMVIFASLGDHLIDNANSGLLCNLLLGSILAVVVGAMSSARLPQLSPQTLQSEILLLGGVNL